MHALSEAQRAFLSALGTRFPSQDRTEDEYQRYIFDTARLTPLGQKEAFQAIYRALLDKDQGPKGGSLLSYLDRDFLIERFSEVSYSRDAFWSETGMTQDACEEWLTKNGPRIERVSCALAVNGLIPSALSPDHESYRRAKGVIELTVGLDDGKEHLLRVLFTDIEGEDVDLAKEAAYLETYGRDFLDEVSERCGIRLTLREGAQVLEEPTDAPIRPTA